MVTTFQIQNVFAISGAGIILVGQVKSGVLRIGMKLKQDGNFAEVISIEAHHKKLETAETGDTVGMNLRGADHTLLKKWIGREVTFY